MQEIIEINLMPDTEFDLLIASMSDARWATDDDMDDVFSALTATTPRKALVN